MTNDEIILLRFEELADQLGILVRDENINIDDVSSNGGLCLVEGKYILILNSKSTVQEKIKVAIKALQQFDLSDVYIKPAIRELLDETKNVQIGMKKSKI
jgi:hypothetical protein